MSSFNNLFQNRFSYKIWYFFFFFLSTFQWCNEWTKLTGSQWRGSDTCKRKMRSQLLTCSTTGEKPTGQMCSSPCRVRQHWRGPCCQEGCLWGHRWGILAFWHEGPQGCSSSVGNQPSAALQRLMAGTDDTERWKSPRTWRWALPAQLSQLWTTCSRLARAEDSNKWLGVWSWVFSLCVVAVTLCAVICDKSREFTSLSGNKGSQIAAVFDNMTALGNLEYRRKQTALPAEQWWQTDAPFSIPVWISRFFEVF